MDKKIKLSDTQQRTLDDIQAVKRDDKGYYMAVGTSLRRNGRYNIHQTTLIYLMKNNLIRECTDSRQLFEAIPQTITISHLTRRPYEEFVTHRFSSLKFTINQKASNDHGTVYWIEGTEDELFKFISSTVSPDITRDQFKRKYID